MEVMILLPRSLLLQLYHRSLLSASLPEVMQPPCQTLCDLTSPRPLFSCNGDFSHTYIFTRIGYTHAPCASVLNDKEWHYSLYTTMD